MNKKIILLSVLIVSMFLMPVGYAESESITQFTFLDTITWDSTPEDVEAVLGDGVQRTEQTDESIGTITMLQKDDTIFAGLNCKRIMIFYYNSKLYTIGCSYAEADVGDPDALIQGMTKIYGTPNMYASGQYTLDDLASGTKTLCDWVIAEDTVIKVVEVNDEHAIIPREEKSPYLYIILFENTTVKNQLKEALSKSETEAEK